MLFKPKKSSDRPSKEEFIRSMQAQTDKMGFGYEDSLNFLSKDLNHFRYKSGSIDPDRNCTYLDYYADESMIEEEAHILEKMVHVMVKNADTYIVLLSPTTIRLEIYL